MLHFNSRPFLTTNAKKQLTPSDGGDFFTKSAIQLNTYIPQGSMIIALLDNGSYGTFWCLFYEQGGDWTVFGDGEEYNLDALCEWMPEAIDSALKEVAEMDFLDIDSPLEDLEWFESWASAAKSTLSQKAD